MALAQAQKVEEVRVFEDQGGNCVWVYDRLNLNRGCRLQGGKLGAFEGLAFDLAV
jgi:hypothetical protein